MAIRKVARLGHPVLRQPCRTVTEAEIGSADMTRLVADMWDTMHEYGGVGLAAPQVHESIRLAVLELDLEPHAQPQNEEPQGFVVFHPRITVLDETTRGSWEGCLSVPGMRGYVERPRMIRVDYLDENGQAASIEASDFLAVVFQHELDHLDGVLYVDKLFDPGMFAFNEEFARYHTG